MKVLLMLIVAITGISVSPQAQQKKSAPAPKAPPKGKPNILVIMADDVGIWNISAYHRGMMGGSTPNIGRLAREGAMFTDAYANQTCTAGRSAFITGQSPFRTGLTKVGLPGANQGIQDKDPTIADLLKPNGYMTAQIGKNHLGDRNEFLPTVHGFDEFYGNLYHLNAEEEPEDPDYPKGELFRSRFGLAPVPFRGKRNEPAYLSYVAESMAKITGKDIEEIAALTSRNAYDVFH
jgi:hypothetical protein